MDLLFIGFCQNKFKPLAFEKRKINKFSVMDIKNNNSKIPRGRVSFVFPVYNEKYTIEKTLLSYHDEFSGKLDFEMIVAEDGSTDGTKNILKELQSRLPIKVYAQDQRKGYLKAIKDALKYPQYEWIFLVDSDHQFNTHDFWKLWPYIGEYDIILGKKTNRKDGSLRSFLSKGYNLLLKVIFKAPYEDMDTGFRLFKKSLANELAPSVGNLGYFTAEFVIKSNDRGYKILEVPVEHLKQEMRSSNIFHIKKLPFIIGKELIGILKLFIEIRVKNNPESK